MRKFTSTLERFMSKILVTGSRGFIGSYLMREIEADEIDLKINSDVRHGIYDKYKTIIFLACNQENTRKAYQENIEMYETLEDYRQRHPKTHLIYISSAAIYLPTSIYAQSKRLGEVYAKRFKNHTILRLSNVYGHGDGHGAPDRFLRGEKTIHGSGEQIRDLISVEIVIDTIIKHLNSPKYGVFNVSSGKGTTVKQMFKLFGEGKPKYVKHDIGVARSVLKPGEVDD